LIQRHVQFQNVDTRLAQNAELPALGVGRHKCPQRVALIPRAAATRGTCASAEAGLISGWRPLPEAVNRSAGRGPVALYLKPMATVTEIGSLIARRPDIRGGRPCVAATGVSVRRIAQWHNMGLIPEEIVETFGGHLSLAQVHAALAYYYANQAGIDADLEAEDRETEALEREHQRSPRP